MWGGLVLGAGRGDEAGSGTRMVLAAIEAIREFFDDIEALAAMEDGDVIIRSELEFILFSLPRRRGVLEDVMGYIESLGAELERVTRNCIYFTLPFESSDRSGNIYMRLCKVYSYGDRVYLAAEPLRIRD